MAEPNNTPRPLSPAAEERTPLLSDGRGESSTQQERTEQTAPLPSSDAEHAESSITTARIFSSIKHITYISLTSSAICLVLLLATFITGELSPYGSGGWTAELLIAQMGTYVCARLSLL
jgi:hypothetical protein